MCLIVRLKVWGKIWEFKFVNLINNWLFMKWIFGVDYGGYISGFCFCYYRCLCVCVCVCIYVCMCVWVCVCILKLVRVPGMDIYIYIILFFKNNELLG